VEVEKGEAGEGEAKEGEAEEGEAKELETKGVKGRWGYVSRVEVAANREVVVREEVKAKVAQRKIQPQVKSPSASRHGSPGRSLGSSPASSQVGYPRSVRGAPQGAVAARIRREEEAGRAS